MKPGQKILVTGADGFIGSHLTERLVERGYDVRAFVYYNSFNSWGWLDQSDPHIKESLDVFSGDIRDPHGVKTAMQGCDGVLHLAALIGIPFSYHSPASYVDTNITGTLNILEAARDLGVSRVIHTSTSEVYGTAISVPISEGHPLQAQSPYSATKIGADQIALSYFRSFETPVTIVRPFNTYGPRQSARAVLPTIIIQLLAGANSVKLGNITPTRDFNYVTDTADGMIAMIETDGIEGEVLNLCSNYEISVGAAAHVIADEIGCRLTLESELERLRPDASEVERLWGDNTKAAQKLDWHPAYAGLEGFRHGIAKTIEWFRSADNQARYKPDQYNI